MLQDLLVKRIERIYRLRLIYALHLALYGALLILSGLAATNSPQWQTILLIAILWLPTIAAHTAAQSLVEIRERCLAYAPAPIQPFNNRAMPVDIYDEQGNRVGDQIDLLPG